MSGPEGTPNGVDRLARMEADARKTLAEDASSSLALWKPWAMDRADDVLALVEIAKAARAIVESIEDAEGFRYVGSEDDIDMLHALADALARLDSGAAEEDA